MTIFKHLKKHYGINNSKAKNIIIYLGINPNTLYKSIPKSKLNILTKIINYYKTQNLIDMPLKEKIKNNIIGKIKLNTIAGKRHRLRYPVRGQRTRSNGKTAKKLNYYKI